MRDVEIRHIDDAREESEWALNLNADDYPIFHPY